MSIKLSQDIAELLNEYINSGASKAFKKLEGYLINEYRNEFMYTGTWKELREMLNVEMVSKRLKSHDLKAINEFYLRFYQTYTKKHTYYIQSI